MTALVELRHNDGNGYSPAARLTLGPDGAFYGTTAYGGSHACGNGRARNDFPVESYGPWPNQ